MADFQQRVAARSALALQTLLPYASLFDLCMEIHEATGMRQSSATPHIVRNSEGPISVAASTVLTDGTLETGEAESKLVVSGGDFVATWRACQLLTLHLRPHANEARVKTQIVCYYSLVTLEQVDTSDAHTLVLAREVELSLRKLHLLGRLSRHIEQRLQYLQRRLES